MLNLTGSNRTSDTRPSPEECRITGLRPSIRPLINRPACTCELLNSTLPLPILTEPRLISPRPGCHGAAAFPPRAFSLAVYRWATAVIDSRAIWWDNRRHLVPMLDLVNCAEGPNAARVHATRLNPAGEYAVTRADRDFPTPGSQVFENYGQPNW